jgi:hypothetical protein
MMNWFIWLLGFEIILRTLQLTILLDNWPFTERTISRMLVVLAVGLAFLVFLLVKSLPSFIRYIVKSYREISRTEKD